MINKIINILHPYNKKITNVNRKFTPKYFIEQNFQNEFEINGFIVIKNCIPKDEIDYLKEKYFQLTKMDKFSITDKFINSGRFPDPEIRNFVIESIKLFSERNLKKIFKIENCSIENGGNFQIKPASKNSILNPHQDSPIIDETKEYAIFIWIPLTNINLTNGPIWVLPKSHKWGNHQRSLNVPWAFEKYTKFLWKHMHPIELNEGDILCFDSALIHASSANLSNETRVAITTTALSKEFQLIEYFKDVSTPKNQVEKYIVTQEYYANEDINKRPDGKYIFCGYENHLFHDISKSNITDFLKN